MRRGWGGCWEVGLCNSGWCVRVRSILFMVVRILRREDPSGQHVTIAILGQINCSLHFGGFDCHHSPHNNYGFTRAAQHICLGYGCGCILIHSISTR